MWERDKKIEKKFDSSVKFRIRVFIILLKPSLLGSCRSILFLRIKRGWKIKRNFLHSTGVFLESFN